MAPNRRTSGVKKGVCEKQKTVMQSQLAQMTQDSLKTKLMGLLDGKPSLASRLLELWDQGMLLQSTSSDRQDVVGPSCLRMHLFL